MTDGLRRDRETERESERELDLKKKTTNKLKKGPEDGVFGQKVRETKRKALKAEAATSGEKKSSLRCFLQSHNSHMGTSQMMLLLELLSADDLGSSRAISDSERESCCGSVEEGLLLLKAGGGGDVVKINT